VRGALLLGALSLVAAGELVSPLPAPGGRGPAPSPAGGAAAFQDDIPYDGRYTFVRIQYESGRGGGLRSFGERSFGGRREPPWAHDYPRAETNFAKIVKETTLIDPFMDGSRILRMDDPEIFKYPILYIVEVGSWQPSDLEISTLRDYLAKGGFLIVDDFRAEQLRRLEEVLHEAVPGSLIQEVPTDHDIFDSFFHIADPYALAPPTFPQYPPVYLGVFEDNDRDGRIMAMLNYNNDIGEYWEFSDMGYYPIDLSNEAYKFGVNYLVYAMTH
jgi:hypothetical protein